MKAKIFSIAALCLAALLVRPSLKSSASGASHTSSVTDWLVQVNDDQGQPISSAFVVVAGGRLDYPQGNDASSAFTSNEGSAQLRIGDDTSSVWVNVVASGYAAHVQRYITTPDSTGTLSVTLESKVCSVYWGTLQDAATSGSGIYVPDLEWRPRAITDATGRYALVLDRTSDLELHTESSAFVPQRWVIDPLQPGTYGSPSPSGITVQPLAFATVTVLNPSGAAAFTDELFVVYREVGYTGLGGWARASKSSTSDFACSLKPGSIYHFIACDGLRWSTAEYQMPALPSTQEPTPVGPIQLEDLTSSILTISQIPESGSLTVTASAINGFWASHSPMLKSYSISQGGDFAIQGLPAGAYDLHFKSVNGVSLSRLDVPVDEMNDPQVTLVGSGLRGPVLNDSSAAGYPLSPALAVPIDSGAVGLNSVTVIVTQGWGASLTRFEKTIAPTDTATFDGLQSGTAEVMAFGKDVSGAITYYQVDGAVSIVLSGDGNAIPPVRLLPGPLLAISVIHVSGGQTPDYFGATEGALIEVYEGDTLVASGLTDAQGTALLTALPRANLTIKASKNGLELSDDQNVDTSLEDFYTTTFASRN